MYIHMYIKTTRSIDSIADLDVGWVTGLEPA